MNKTEELLRLEVINSTQLLNLLYDEWLALFNRCPGASPFLSPDWLIPWWKHFKAGKLFTIILRIDGKLSGIAPLYIHNLSEKNTWQLTFIGTGNTDYMDLLVEQEYSEVMHQELLNYLSDHSSEWDICYFAGLRKNSALLKTQAPAHFRLYSETSGLSPVADLPETFDLYYKMLPVSFRKNVKRACSNLAKTGNLKLETAERNTIPVFLNDLYTLHIKSWEARNGQGVLKGAEVKSFLEEVSQNFLRNGILKLYRLRFNGRPIAAVYSMLWQETLYYYIGGFEPDMKKYSPGSVIIYMIIEGLIKKGIHRFDFLSGAEPYKYNWAAKDEQILRLLIHKLNM